METSPVECSCHLLDLMVDRHFGKQQDAAMCIGNARAVGPIRETVILCLCSNGTLRFLERPPDPFCNETCKGSCVHLNARTIQSLQILCAVFNANHRPRIPARSEQYIHQEAGHAAIAIGIGMNLAKEPMTEHGPNRWFRFRLDQIEQRGHGVAHRFPTRRNIP